MPLDLAKRSNCAATSLIWLTLPAVESTVEQYMVCTESTIIRSGAVSWASARMAPISVSLKMRQLDASPPSLSARIFTCFTDSSPVTYSVFSSGRCRGNCSERVLLPIPGSPPISTRDPFTMPPPSRRSTSALPSDTRSSCVVDTSFSGIDLREAPGTVIVPAFLPVTTSCSTIVFHSPHAGHRPIHLEYSLPQWLQNHTVLVFALAISLVS